MAEHSIHHAMWLLQNHTQINKTLNSRHSFINKTKAIPQMPMTNGFNHSNSNLSIDFYQSCLSSSAVVTFHIFYLVFFGFIFRKTG